MLKVYATMLHLFRFPISFFFVRDGIRKRAEKYVVPDTSYFILSWWQYLHTKREKIPFKKKWWA